jgi:hypothetical protein
MSSLPPLPPPRQPLITDIFRRHAASPPRRLSPIFFTPVSPPDFHGGVRAAAHVAAADAEQADAA